jgi:hypothetical protein
VAPRLPVAAQRAHRRCTTHSFPADNSRRRQVGPYSLRPRAASRSGFPGRAACWSDSSRRPISLKHNKKPLCCFLVLVQVGAKGATSAGRNLSNMCPAPCGAGFDWDRAWLMAGGAAWRSKGIDKEPQAVYHFRTNVRLGNSARRTRCAFRRSLLHRRGGAVKWWPQPGPFPSRTATGRLASDR